MDFSVVKTPIGFLKICREDGAVTGLSYRGKEAERTHGSDPALARAERELAEYFAGRRKTFSLPLLIKTTPFRKRVLEELLKVGYGRTVTYGELAAAVGSPGAARAVGSAMRTNPIAVIIPCHRVLPAVGKPGNYSAGGPENKKFLLALEKSVLEKEKDIRSRLPG